MMKSKESVGLGGWVGRHR